MSWMVVGKEPPGEGTGGLNRFVAGYLDALQRRFPGVDAYFGGAAPERSAPVRMFGALVAGWRSSPDFIDSHFAMYGAPFILGARCRRLISRRSRGRQMVHFHGPWGEESAVAAGLPETGSSVSTRLKTILERYVLRGADRVVVLSPDFAREAVRLGASPDRTVVIGPGLDDDWFTAAPSSTEKSSPDVELLCVRRLTRRMGHAPLIDALSELDFEVAGRRVVLHIVGTGEEQSTLEKRVAADRLDDVVRLHGRLSDADLRRLGGRCHAAVIPTLALEGFGLVVIEAMAMGLPVISTGQGGLRAAMGPWAREPFIFDLKDSVSLARSIRHVLEDPDDASQEDLQRYARSFTWSQVVGETVSGFAP
jgi:glycosyltransferase involved in cell wall biosynthesis